MRRQRAPEPTRIHCDHDDEQTRLREQQTHGLEEPNHGLCVTTLQVVDVDDDPINGRQASIRHTRAGRWVRTGAHASIQRSERVVEPAAHTALRDQGGSRFDGCFAQRQMPLEAATPFLVGLALCFLAAVLGLPTGLLCFVFGILRLAYPGFKVTKPFRRLARDDPHGVQHPQGHCEGTEKGSKSACNDQEPRRYGIDDGRQKRQRNDTAQ